MKKLEEIIEIINQHRKELKKLSGTTPREMPTSRHP